MQQSEEEKTEETDAAGMKILVVEDNEINMEIAEFYLTEAGAKTEKHGMEPRQFRNFANPKQEVLM